MNKETLTLVSEKEKKIKIDQSAMPIYTITTVRGALESPNRSVGFAYKFEDADKWVRENIMNINECGYYPFAVIENVTQGIYCFPRKEHWYKFNKEKDSYEPCEKPERFKIAIGWSLG